MQALFVRFYFAYTQPMQIGGYDKRVDYSKLGGAVLIGACVVLAVRTARWPVTVRRNDQPDNALWQEVGYSIRLALEVMSTLASQHQHLFAQKDVPWYMPTDEDVPR